MSYKSFSASQDAMGGKSFSASQDSMGDKGDKGAAGKSKIIPMTKLTAPKPGEAPAKATPAVKS